jgi:hypothetical protein
MQPMPEVEYRTTMSLPREHIWEFVKDMNNWAPFLTGYQAHEVLDDTDSVWTLKGDVGILSRVVRLKAHVTEWNGPERVSFTLTGLNEKVDGGGELTMVTTGHVGDAAPLAPPGLLRRFFTWIARALFRAKFGPGPKRLSTGSAAAVSELRFKLRMDAGGPTGPLVNAMLGPALYPAAEDLANKIAAHLEGANAPERAA